MTIRLDSPGPSEAFDIAMPTPPIPSLTADSGTIESPRLDQTLAPGVYRIINDGSSNIVVDLSGFDKSSILGKLDLALTSSTLAEKLTSLSGQPTMLTREKIKRHEYNTLFEWASK